MIDLRWIFCILDTLSVFLRIFGGVFMKERNIHKQRHYSVPRITATTCIRSSIAPCYSCRQVGTWPTRGD